MKRNGRPVSGGRPHTPFDGKEASKVSEPLDDMYEWVATYTAPPGQHWTQVGKGWGDGPVASTCEDTTAKQRETAKRVGEVC